MVTHAKIITHAPDPELPFLELFFFARSNLEFRNASQPENSRYFRIPLHHFCCHTSEERMKISTAMDEIGWAPTEITLSGGVCTDDGDGKKGIHLAVDKKSHKKLLDLTRLIRFYGGKNNKPAIEVGRRIDAFRAKLVTVDPTFNLQKGIMFPYTGHTQVLSMHFILFTPLPLLHLICVHGCFTFQASKL